MDEGIKRDLEQLIETYNIRLKDDGSGLTWSGFPYPDKLTLAHIKMNSDLLIEILKEKV